MKKKALITLLLLVMMLLLAACGDQKKENKYVAFYLNADVTKIVPQDVELTSTTPTEQIQELLKLLQQQPEDAGLRQTIPKNIKVLGVTEVAYQITVDFSKDYYELNPTEEILTRAAIAKTLLQLEKYPYVMFTVESKPLETTAGTTVGAMSEDSFLENPGDQFEPENNTYSLFLKQGRKQAGSGKTRGALQLQHLFGEAGYGTADGGAEGEEAACDDAGRHETDYDYRCRWSMLCQSG